MKKLTLAIFIAASASAQPVVAPTNAPLGTARGEDFSGYNITNSFETGYRFRSVGGDLGKYRSDVNFGNGVRLLSGNLTVNSKEGHGQYFDELLISTQGLGNDPYQYSSVRLQKNRLYRYDMTMRTNDYFNPALPLASGQHFQNTRKGLSDHSIVLLPNGPFRLFAGYSRVGQDGPALSTTSLSNARGDEFPLFTDVRRTQNEYRFGFEVSLLGAKLSVLRSWEYFKDDTRRTSGPSPGNNPLDEEALTSFRRDEPYHGSTKSWRANLLWDKLKYVTLNGRFTYSGGRRNFIFDESSASTARFAGTQNRQVLVFGSGRRPVTTAAITTSFYPASTLTITNNTAYHNIRIDGDARYSQLDNASLSFQTLEFQYLGIRTFTSSTDANYRPSKTFGLFGGYQFSTRRVRSIQQSSFENIADRLAFDQT
ncbi:MAG: hypothetical protein H7Y20_03825, partial [Bryobacteraceae bacterium]|nr:hypothetical protein [Bryobacteraceae bacterium]